MLSPATGSFPTSKTRVAAVVGSPVAHSLSPLIHNAAFAHLKLDWIYAAFEVPEHTAGTTGGAAAVAAMRTLGLAGLSVTMPHKQAVAAAVDHSTQTVKALGACNCVFWDGLELVGDNTDGAGFVQSLLRDEAVDVAGKRIAVVGTGGVARAIIEATGRAGAAEIFVVGRSQAKAEAAAALAPLASVQPVEACADADIISNATPIGMTGWQNPEGIPVPPELINDTHVVHDAIYDPRVTPLLAAAEQRGAKTINGTGMLVHQAAAAFTHWTGKPAPLAVMTTAAFAG